MGVESSKEFLYMRSSEIHDRMYAAQTEALFHIADQIAVTHDMLGNISEEIADKVIAGHSLDDLTDFLEVIQPGSKEHINALMNQAVSEYYIELEGYQKKK